MAYRRILDDSIDGRCRWDYSIDGFGVVYDRMASSHGMVSPLSHQDWLDVFDSYKASPQYLEVNAWMGLEDFKQIFFWEYVHRVLGRLIGLAFFLPWLFFVLRRHLRGVWIVKTLIAFLLGGAQGFMGWFMVQSGLVDVPEVSHFRLAAHLSLAFILVPTFCGWP